MNDIEWVQSMDRIRERIGTPEPLPRELGFYRILHEDGSVARENAYLDSLGAWHVWFLGGKKISGESLRMYLEMNKLTLERESNDD